MKQIITRFGRPFDDQITADRYADGFRSFPRWPMIGTQEADHNTPEAQGYYDAEREWEEAYDRKRDRDIDIEDREEG